MNSLKEGHSICLLNDSFPPMIDGVSNTVVNYANIIEKNHGHSMVITPSVPSADDSAYDFPVVRYRSLDTRKYVGYVAGYPFSPVAANAVAKRNVQLLHTHSPATAALLAQQLAESMHLPLVLTWHTKFDIDIASVLKNKILQTGAIQAFLYNVNGCDEVWTVSKGAGENLRSVGYEGDYIVMPNGVDLPREKVPEEVVARTTKGYDLPHDVPCFLFVGRLMWYKGIRIILDALARLDSDGQDFRMVFIGSGKEGDEMREYTRELGISDKVFFTGAIHDREALRAWYTRADLFLFPSSYDTNGLVVREAAANDTASVIIKDSCASEDVTDGRTGFLIDETAEAMFCKLKELIASRETLKKIGCAAGDEIYISWEDAVSRACDRYEIVIDNYKRGVYRHRNLLKGTWMRSQGEMMQLFGKISAAMKTIRS